jgi:hypothetical protein
MVPRGEKRGYEGAQVSAAFRPTFFCLLGLSPPAICQVLFQNGNGIVLVVIHTAFQVKKRQRLD